MLTLLLISQIISTIDTSISHRLAQTSQDIVSIKSLFLLTIQLRATPPSQHQDICNQICWKPARKDSLLKLSLQSFSSKKGVCIAIAWRLSLDL